MTLWARNRTFAPVQMFGFSGDETSICVEKKASLLPDKDLEVAEADTDLLTGSGRPQCQRLPRQSLGNRGPFLYLYTVDVKRQFPTVL